MMSKLAASMSSATLTMGACFPTGALVPRLASSFHCGCPPCRATSAIFWPSSSALAVNRGVSERMCDCVNAGPIMRLCVACSFGPARMIPPPTTNLMNSCQNFGRCGKRLRCVIAFQEAMILSMLPSSPATYEAEAGTREFADIAQDVLYERTSEQAHQ